MKQSKKLLQKISKKGFRIVTNGHMAVLVAIYDIIISVIMWGFIALNICFNAFAVQLNDVNNRFENAYNRIDNTAICINLRIDDLTANVH